MPALPQPSASSQVGPHRLRQPEVPLPRLTRSTRRPQGTRPPRRPAPAGRPDVARRPQPAPRRAAALGQPAVGRQLADGLPRRAAAPGPTPAAQHPDPPSRSRPRPSNSTSCTPSSAQKKSGLRLHGGRPGHPRHCRLASGGGARRGAMQAVVDQAPAAGHYFSDGLQRLPDADVRAGRPTRSRRARARRTGWRGATRTCGTTWPAWGARAGASRRCIEALRRAVFLFVHCYNERQLWQRAHPKYRAAIIDFLPQLN